MLAPNEFGIAVPLPARILDRSRLPENLAPGDHIVEKLGRLRVEITRGEGDLVVSIESESSRQLRLFQRANGEWRRLATSKDQSWTLAPEPDGAVEMGIGVLMPEARRGEPQPAWPRKFDVLVSSQAHRGERTAHSVPRGTIRHSLGTRAGRRTDDRLPARHR